MNKIRNISTLSILLIISLLIITGCAPSVSQKEYDSVKSELNQASGEVATLQTKLNESLGQIAAYQDKLNKAMVIEAQYQDLDKQYRALKVQDDARIAQISSLLSDFNALNTRYEQLKVQDNSRTSEIKTIQAANSELTKKFEELKKQYDNIIQGTVILNEKDIDQAIFELINEERTNNGVSRLLWGVNLYGWANQNSREMAAQGKYLYSGAGAIWQDVFMAVRYGTVDQIANAALTIWKINDYSYKYNIINAQSKYGAVASYKLGEIYYITYITSIFE